MPHKLFQMSVYFPNSHNDFKMVLDSIFYASFKGKVLIIHYDLEFSLPQKNKNFLV